MAEITPSIQGEARQLLNAARMILDRAANGHNVEGEAAFVSQRIVDAIGHSTTDENPARSVALPASWRLGAHGEPIAAFDYLHLRLHGDGTVTWFEDSPRHNANEDRQPHSRACGITPHPHGPRCAADCPTCRAHSGSSAEVGD